MHAVRTTLSRVLTTAGLAGVLLAAPVGSAWADPTPTPDPSATSAPSATPAPIPSETTAPAPSDTPSAEPSSGCEQNPVICQSGGAPGGTTTDCGQIGPGGQPASPPPPGTVCIAGGLNPGANPGEVTPVSTTAGSGAQQLPRTGPAPLLPTAAVGTWLVLLGALAGFAGRRRTARI